MTTESDMDNGVELKSSDQTEPCFYCGRLTVFVCGSCNVKPPVCTRCWSTHERREHEEQDE